MLSALSHKDDYDWAATSYTCRRCKHADCGHPARQLSRAAKGAGEAKGPDTDSEAEPAKESFAMTKEKLLEVLRNLKDIGDSENGHVEADFALLNYINDDEITEAFKAVPRWYA